MCIYQTEEGVVLHSKDLCIGCGYCFYACPFGAPQYPQAGNFGSRGKMDKCTFCAGGPEEDNSGKSSQKYGRNRLAEGKLPLCAEMCSTKALLGGDGSMVSDIYRERVVARGFGSGAWGWGTAYQSEVGLVTASFSSRIRENGMKFGGGVFAAPTLHATPKDVIIFLCDRESGYFIALWPRPARVWL